MSFWKHLRIALLSAFGLGVLLGHLDIAVRVAAKTFEWFELYQAILVPALILGGLYTAIAVLLEVLFKLRKPAPDPQRIAGSYFFFSLFLAALVFLASLSHFICYGDLLFWDPSRATLNAAVLFVVSIGSMLLLVFQRGKLEALFQFLQSGWRYQVVSNYLFFIGVSVAACLAIDLYLLRQIPDGPRTGGAGPAASANVPNVIVITLDTVRADHCSFLGYPKPTTPFLAEFAKEAVVFENVRSVTSWTLPAHASLFTGLYPFRHGATEAHQVLDEHALSLAEIFALSGYRTAGFVGGPYCKAKYGLAQGFEKYHDRLDFFEYQHTHDGLSARRVIDFFSQNLRITLFGNDGERGGAEINHDVFRWLDQVKGDPFFMFVNYFDAHDPYDRGREYRPQFLKREVDDEPLNHMVRSYYFDPVMRYKHRSVPESLREILMGLYDSELRAVDDHVRALVEELRSRGLLENTVIVITSDHGEEFFEHGGVMHKQTLYDEVLRVPLLIKFGDKLKPLRISTPVSLIDISPTVLRLLGMPTPDGLDGRSLVGMIRGGTQLDRQFVLAERDARKEHGESDLKAIISENEKYIRVQPELERMKTGLYDLSRDPHEKTNLIASQPARAIQLEAELDGHFQGSSNGPSLR